jgi:hypothetical protein
MTDTEKSDTASVIKNHDNRTDEPYQMMIRNNNGGEYRGVYYDKVYHVNEAQDEVVYEEEIIGSPGWCPLAQAACVAGVAGIVLCKASATYSCGSILLGVTAPASVAFCAISLAECGISVFTTTIGCGTVDSTCS